MTTPSEELKALPVEQRIARVLESWDTTTKYLRYLSPEQILKAIGLERARAEGSRMNILFRLAQRYDNVTKHKRLKKLIQ
jgi:hypothetical protein